MTCTVEQVIKPSAMRNVLRYRDGDTNDIIAEIMRMDKEGGKYIDAEGAECLRGKSDLETMRNVWRFVRKNVDYVTDKAGKEVIKSPAALFRMGKGDCKSFTIAVVAILKALGFKGLKYRFVAFAGQNTVRHVYAVCKLAGQEVILDAVLEYFNYEAPYTWRIDIPADKQSAVNGPQGQNRPSAGKIIGFLMVAYALNKL